MQHEEGGQRFVVVAHRDLAALLVPAEFASVEPEKAPARENLTATVPADVATRIKEKARRRGVSVSALLAPVIAEFAAAE